MSEIKTWGQALDWQFKRWKRLASAKTNQINSNHITRHVGRSFPISKMGKAGFWMELQVDLLDEGRSSSTVNRIISAGTTVLHETFSNCATPSSLKLSGWPSASGPCSALLWLGPTINQVAI